MVVARVILFALFSLLAFISGTELYYRHHSAHISLDRAPLEAARDMNSQGYYEDALLLAEFSAKTATGDTESNQAKMLVHQIGADRTFGRNAESFLQGAISGEPKDIAGFLGSLSLDLFVVGDIRDLVVQGWKEYNHGDGDVLILALSGIGLATTLTPQMDFAPALLKLFRRAGALGERFIKSVSKLGRQAIKSGDFSHVGKVVSDFGSASRTLGPAPLSRIMKHVEDPSQLARLARAAEKDATSAYSLSYLGGAKAIKAIDASGKNVSRLAKMTRRGSRLSKIVAKGSSSLPDHMLWLVFVFSCLLVLRGLTRILPRSRISPRLVKSDSGGIPILDDAVR